MVRTLSWRFFFRALYFRLRPEFIRRPSRNLRHHYTHYRDQLQLMCPPKTRSPHRGVHVLSRLGNDRDHHSFARSASSRPAAMVLLLPSPSFLAGKETNHSRPQQRNTYRRVPAAQWAESPKKCLKFLIHSNLAQKPIIYQCIPLFWPPFWETISLDRSTWVYERVLVAFFSCCREIEILRWCVTLISIFF